MKIASPLFILRRECAEDLPSVLEQLAALGFDGVEFLGLFGHSAGELRRRMDDLGMTALGDHVPYRLLAAEPGRVLDEHAALGCRYLTVAELPDGPLDRLAGPMEELAALARQRDIRLLYHNHARELTETVGGQPLLDAIMAAFPPQTLALEPDLGWIGIAGGSPSGYLRRYRDRCPVIHLKDYYADGPVGDIAGRIPPRGDPAHGNFEFRPTGYGVLDLPGLMDLCLACRPDWFVVDHDLACQLTSYQELDLSLRYVRNLLSLLQM